MAEKNEQTKQSKLFDTPKYPPMFQFVDVGDYLIGKVKEIGTLPLKNKYAKDGDPLTRDATFIQISPDDGASSSLSLSDTGGEGKDVTVWCGAVIESFIENKEIKVGDTIGIKYEGKNEEKNYQVFDCRKVNKN